MDKKLYLLKNKQDECFLLMSKIIGSFSSPVRLKLIHFLSQAPLSVEILAQKIDQSVANTSMHLRKMLSEKIVNVEVVGQKRLYSLRPELKLFWEQCQDLSMRVDPNVQLPIEEVYGDINWKFSEKETFQMIKNNELIILDVRPDDEYGDENTPLADFILQIPSSEIKQRMEELPRRKKILILCRGRMCALSGHTVNLLRENNFKAFRLEKSWFQINDLLKWNLK